MTPATRGPSWIILGLALLGAACATGPGAPAPPEEAEAAAVLRAFAHVCGRLEPAEVERRSRGLGFVPVDPARLPVRPPPGVQLMARPPATEGGVSAVLGWNATAPSCELAVTAISPAAAEREFARMVEVLARQPSLRLQSIPVPAEAARDPAGLPLRQVVVVVSRQTPQAPPQMLTLRTGGEEGGPRRVRAIFAILVGRPQAGGAAIPPPSVALAPPKD